MNHSRRARSLNSRQTKTANVTALDVAIKQAHPKLHFGRSLEGYHSPYNDPFEYPSILDVGIGDNVYSECLGPIGRDRLTADLVVRGKAELKLLIAQAEDAYDPRYWWIPHLSGSPIGLVFPQLFYDLPGAGSVWHIGVLKAYRGRGYGRIIHARALEALAHLGAKRYIGSTQIDNYAMMKVFAANGCAFRCFRICEDFVNGGGRALD